jgi:hypothetical protein
MRTTIVRSIAFGLIFLLLVNSLTACAVQSEEASETPFTGVLAPPSEKINPPKGTVMPEMESLETLEELQEEVKFPLLTPAQGSLPAGMIFKSAKRLTADSREAVTTVYASDSEELDIQQIKLDAPMGVPAQDHEATQVRGKSGYFVTFPETGTIGLIWEEDGRMVSLSGPFSKDDLLRIAAGLVKVPEDD